MRSLLMTMLGVLVAIVGVVVAVWAANRVAPRPRVSSASVASIDKLRESIEERLRVTLEQAGRLRAALVALDGSPVAPAKALARRSSVEASRVRRRRSARGTVRQAVLEALTSGEPRTAGEIAAAAGLNRTTVAGTLTGLLKDGTLTKAMRGYQLASSSGPDSGQRAGDRALKSLNAELDAGLRTRGGA